MKTFRLKSSTSFSPTKLACAGLLVFALSFAELVAAQPRMGGRNISAAERTERMSKRMFAAIEEKTGKKLTATQKQKLTAAIKAHAEATKAANERLSKQVTSITGLKPDDFRGFGRGGGMRGQR